MKHPGPLAEIDDREGFLASDPEEINGLREYTRTGRPYGDEMFIACPRVYRSRVKTLCLSSLSDRQATTALSGTLPDFLMIMKPKLVDSKVLSLEWPRVYPVSS